jgi:hypothetical protein
VSELWLAANAGWVVRKIGANKTAIDVPPLSHFYFLYILKKPLNGLITFAPKVKG